MTAAETFWDFSLRTYSQAGVAEACLTLQDEYGADVNLLLYCCWAGWYSVALDEETFRRALEVSRTWADNVVRPLRDVRRWMKNSGCTNELVDTNACLDFREKVKSVELRAEKIQQAMLESLPLHSLRDKQVAPGPGAVAANLRRYCAAAGIKWTDEVRLNLGVILRAAFPRACISELNA